MKTNFTATLLFILSVTFAYAQTPGINSSVQISAVVDQNGNAIDVQWNAVADADNYNVYRKVEGTNNWSTLATYLSPSTLNFLDTNVSPGISYEYKIKCNRLANTKEAFGYINASGQLPMVESRGRILLLIDNHFQNTLSFEIERLKKDLVGDGWQVNIEYVDRNASPASVKSIVQGVHNTHADLTSLYLLGQIPVPYSGAIAPDGHFDHLGAWPTDGFYGDINFTWGDNSTNSTGATHPRNHNVPFDGKYDHSYFPSNIELEIGRVDMRDLPAFAESEEDLLRYYLDKSHLFKTGQITAEAKAVVDDNFTSFDFSNSAWKGYSALVGKDNVDAQDYLTCLQTKSHLFSYGSGGGSYSSANGVISTQDYANESPKGIFTMLLGSYFGEWNTSDNLLRAAIASGDILTSTWVGLPNYYFHHMGMGKHIGHSIRLSQNNTDYQYEPAGYYARMVHMSLMGDPTLRMHYIDTPKNASNVVSAGDVELSWEASSDADVIGYHIYRSSNGGDFIRLTAQAVASTSFTDPCMEEDGAYEYMVRALKLQATPTGSYFNLSTGVFTSVVIDETNNCFSALPVELLSFEAIRDDRTVDLTWKTASENNFSHFEIERGGEAQRFEYLGKQLGKGTGAASVLNYAYTDEQPLTGTSYYRLKLVDLDGSFEYSAIKEVYLDRKEMSLYPNPAKGKIFIELPVFDADKILVEVLDFKGARVWNQSLGNRQTQGAIALDLTHLPEGAYIIKVLGGESVFSKTFLLESQ